MNFGTHMMCNQSDNALTIGCCQAFTAIGQSHAQPFDPEESVRIEHNFDDLRVSQPGRDRCAHPRAQHACAALTCFISAWLSASRITRFMGGTKSFGPTGTGKRTKKGAK